MNAYFKSLQESSIVYKPSDFKTELHFLGQIIGATNVSEHDAIFLEAFFEIGKEWKILGKKSSIQTQASVVDHNDYICFAHPFDLHLTTENLNGWPRIVCRLWKLGDTNKTTLLSYGTAFLPNCKGYHEFEFNTFCLKEKASDESLWAIFNSKPFTSRSDPLDAYLNERKDIFSKPGPKIKMSCEVILRNFKFYGLSGGEGMKEQADEIDEIIYKEN